MHEIMAQYRGRDTARTTTNETSLESAQKVAKYTREPDRSVASSRRETRANAKINVFKNKNSWLVCGFSHAPFPSKFVQPEGGLSWFRQSPCRAWTTGFDSIAQLAFEASHISAEGERERGYKVNFRWRRSNAGWMTQMGIFW